MWWMKKAKQKKFYYNFLKFYLLQMMDKNEIIKLLYQSDKWDNSNDAYTLINETLESIKDEAEDILFKKLHVNLTYKEMDEMCIKYIEYFNLNKDNMKNYDITIAKIKYRSLYQNTQYKANDRVVANYENMSAYAKILHADGHSKTFIIKMLRHFGLSHYTCDSYESLVDKWIP